jgi:hypothetical protein
MIRRVWCLLAMLALLAGCSSSTLSFTPAVQALPAGTQVAIDNVAYDSLEGGPCSVSSDGIFWYALTPGRFAPVWASYARCTAGGTLRSTLPVPLPQWSVPRRPTQALFAAVSLQDELGFDGMGEIEAIAAAHQTPVTWLVGNGGYLLAHPDTYNAYHHANGDDVEVRPGAAIAAAATQVLPWYTPAVSVLGAGFERDIAAALPIGAFWGITWNSHGTDRTFDQGAPWGTYCADPASYKRPDPAGACGLLAMEWTARDLTRAYYSEREDAFSTVPEDLIERARFNAQTVVPYVRSLVDAYAAAGQDQPLVLIAEEESANFTGDADRAVLDTLYAEAQATGMARVSLRDAAGAARAFSNVPRAVAFPYIDAGNGALMPQRISAATIDFHDNEAGMTFEAGRTGPSRIYPYALSPVSRYFAELARLLPQQMPHMTLAGVSNGSLTVRVDSPGAVPYGIAMWTDAGRAGLSGPGVFPAGSAGAVLRFDVPAGVSDHSFACTACTSMVFAYPR